MIAMLLLACSSPDPELLAVKKAVNAWDDGVETLDAGEPEQAVSDFERALEARPDDVLLLAWRARAEARAGRLEVAVDTLGQVLRARPDFVEARYNRAAYLARLGRLGEAGPELILALEGGAGRPEDVLGDADFVPHLGHPALQFLPRQALKVMVEGRDSDAFWASEIPVRLLVLGNGDADVALELGQVQGPAEVVKAVQDLVQTTDGPSTEVVWTLRITGAGPVEIGPWTVTSGGRRATHPALKFQAVAPEDREEPTARLSGPLILPEVLAGARGDLEGWRQEGRRWIKVKPGDRIVLPGPSLRLERRRGPVLEWIAHGVEAEGLVQVNRGGKVVYTDSGAP
jgi:hypothetical protein